MTVFRYKAATASGEVLEGEMEAVSRDTVVRRLQAQGHVAICADEVERSSGDGAVRRRRFMSRKPGERDVSLTTLELASLLHAGVTLDRALAILAQITEDDLIRKLLTRLHDKVRRGAPLSDAMKSEGGAFSRFHVNLVRTGEAGGTLESTLGDLAAFMERSRKMREDVLSALIYPLILLALAVTSIVVILTFVVPRFAELFEDAGAILPWPTRAVMGAGAFLQHDGLLLGLAAALLWWLGGRLRRDPAIALWWDTIMLRLPLIGALLEKHETARFTRSLGTLVSNGVPLLEAMGVANDVVSNRLFASALGQVADRVRDGQGLARPLMASGVFPRLAGHMLQVGEETGRLEDMLLKLAEIYEREVRNTLNRMVVVLEPVMILGLGLLVAAIIFSILVAVLSVNELAFL